MPFPDALKQFSDHGSFELSNAYIVLDNIRLLEKAITQLKEDKPEITLYHIRLSNVQLFSGFVPRPKIPEHILSGTVVEHSSRPWNGKFSDVALVQMGATHEFNAPLNFMHQKARQEANQEQTLAALKKALLALLALPATWHSIELDHVFFYHHEDAALTDDFYSELLTGLAKNNALTQLTIKPFSLSTHKNSLVNWLTQPTQLETLNLETSEANREDWLALSQTLARHPTLKSFNLGHSHLDATAYSALIHLADENYRIHMTLSEPTEEDLINAYEPLKQRLSMPGLVRFKENHLSQDTLMHVAVTALESIQQLKSSRRINQIKERTLLAQQFNFLLTNQGDLAITAGEKESWIKSAQILPAIYTHHVEYLKSESTLVQLHVNALVADGSKTVGYVLLEKALSTSNRQAMDALLTANANLFESPDNEQEPFLVKVFDRKDDLKKLVVSHLQKHDLVERAREYLAPYPQLIDAFNELKTHLDNYSTHLVKKDNPYTLLHLSHEILSIWRKLFAFKNPTDDRGKECATIYLDLDKSLQAINNGPAEVTYAHLRNVQVIMQRIKKNSLQALRGMLNRSFLHEKVIHLVDQFEEGLEHIKDQINDKKDEAIKHKDEALSQLHESRETEKRELSDKLATSEAELADIKTENADIKTEIAEMKTENAEIKEKQARMEATLNQLLRQMATPNAAETSRASSSHSETSAEPRTHFFARP